MYNAMLELDEKQDQTSEKSMMPVPFGSMSLCSMYYLAIEIRSRLGQNFLLSVERSQAARDAPSRGAPEDCSMFGTPPLAFYAPRSAVSGTLAGAVAAAPGDGI